MIKQIAYANVYVLDLDEAKAFYTEKLGFEVRDDVRMEGFRWLTVRPAGKRDPSLVLMPIAAPMMDEEDVKHMRALVAKGALGAGVLHTDDCHATFKELSARGVEFLQEPAERPYGVEAVLRDNSGNWFSLTQRHG